MADLIQEVDEMMRQEKMAKLWKDYGNYIIGFIVFIILLTAGVSAYKSWSHYQRTNQTALLLEALEDEGFIRKAPVLAGELGSGLDAVALLTAASRALEKEDEQAALALYRQAAQDDQLPGTLRGLGIVMQSRLVDEKSPEIISALEKLAQNQDSPWRFHAGMELAVISANTFSDYTAARRYLQSVLNLKSHASYVPTTLIQRAEALDHVYSLKQAQNPQIQEGS